jgi:hypothetical protein
VNILVCPEPSFRERGRKLEEKGRMVVPPSGGDEARRESGRES